jgi:hypothetical protein
MRDIVSVFVYKDVEKLEKFMSGNQWLSKK